MAELPVGNHTHFRALRPTHSADSPELISEQTVQAEPLSGVPAG